MEMKFTVKKHGPIVHVDATGKVCVKTFKRSLSKAQLREFLRLRKKVAATGVKKPQQIAIKKFLRMGIGEA